jgi:chromosome segregation ATPase
MATKDDLAAELSEAKREQARIEKKFDEASEYSREERRKLNSEISDLYRSLEKARKTSPQSTAVDDGEAARLRTELDKVSAEHLQAEEELAAGKDQWEAERGKLKESMAKLESKLVEAIERANNPQRAASAAEDSKAAAYQARIQKLEAQAGKQVEEARKGWASERAELELELDRLKKVIAPRPKATIPSPASTPPTATAQSGKSSKGKKFSLADKLRARFDSGPNAEPSPTPAIDSKEMDSLRSNLASLEQERAELVQRAGELDQALSETRKQAEILSGERDSIRDERDRLMDTAEKIETGEKAFQKAREEWESERSRLEARVVEVEQNALQNKDLKKKGKGQGDEAVACSPSEHFGQNPLKN